MTEQELLAELLAKDWVDGFVGEPQVQGAIKPNDDVWKFINVREVVGKAAIYRNIHYYVIDGGTPDERAYYKDREPAAIIKELDTV